MDTKMGARVKACMMLGYVHDTIKIWRIWDPDFGKAINCSDVYVDESQTAYTSCMHDNGMLDNDSGIDPLGLPEEDPVITEVVKEAPALVLPPEDTSTANPLMRMVSVEEPPALDPPEKTITPPAGMGSVEEAPALDPQSVPDGAPNASPSQRHMLTRSQSRRAARAGTTLAAEVSTDDDPQSYREAMNSPFQRQWKAAMQQEYASLLENNTFTPVEYAYSKPIGCKWVYKTKTNPNGTLRYKAQLVIKGYEQVQGVDFEETYAPVSKLPTLHYLMSCVTQGGWEIDQLEVVTAFLNPAIDKDVYMQLPEGIDWLINKPLPASSTHNSTHKSPHKSTHNSRTESRSAVSRAENVSTPNSAKNVSTLNSSENQIFTNGSLKLNKALYGLKQAPLLWHATINKFLLSIGCIRAHADEYLYLCSGVFLLLYVDDTQIFYPPSASEAAEELKAALKKEYKMTDLGKPKQFLGLEIERHDSGAISLRQSKYIRTILKRFGMHQQKNEKLKYIAFFPSETPILNFLSRHFRGYKRDYFFQNPYGSKI